MARLRGNLVDADARKQSTVPPWESGARIAGQAGEAGEANEGLRPVDDKTERGRRENGLRTGLDTWTEDAFNMVVSLVFLPRSLKYLVVES